MAKVKIEIEDLPDGKVKIVAEPNFETIMAMDTSGAGLTAAHGYALYALNQIRNMGKTMGPKQKLWLPRIGS